jgi:hypothetical protein
MHVQTRSAIVFIALLSFPAFVLARTPPVSNAAAPQEGTESPSSQEASAPAPAPANSAPAQSQNSAPATRPGENLKQQKKKKKPLPQMPQPQQAEKTSEPQQTKRMMWVVPNFAAVSAGVKFKPMTPKQKFWMATEDSFDYSSFVWTGVLAAQDYALDSYPELGTGAAGYSRYYWRGVLDGVSNSYFSEAIVPVLTHEDSRYFTMGHGGFGRRLGYALSRVVITYSDSGKTTFNCGEVCGDLASSALSTAYYPPQERGIVKISEGWGTQLESAALNNIAKEFWPDIRKYVFHKH